MPQGYPTVDIEVLPDGRRRCTQVHIYEHTWETVLAAYNSRFPTHPRLPNMLRTSISDQVVNDAEGTETYTRIAVAKAASVPWVLRTLTGLHEMEMSQEVEVDHYARCITMNSKNATWRETVKMDEICTYCVDTENADWTYFKQVATLSVEGLAGMESTVEDFLIKEYSSGIGVGRVVDEELIQDLLAKGGDHVPTWAEQHPVEAAARCKSLSASKDVAGAANGKEPGSGAAPAPALPTSGEDELAIKTTITVQFAVPANAASGQHMSVPVPGGQTLTVVVPDGATPGTLLQIEVPGLGEYGQDLGPTAKATKPAADVPAAASAKDIASEANGPPVSIKNNTPTSAVSSAGTVAPPATDERVAVPDSEGTSYRYGHVLSVERQLKAETAAAAWAAAEEEKRELLQRQGFGSHEARSSEAEDDPRNWPNILGIPLPGSLFHPIPNAPIVSTQTAHLFGWKIPDILFHQPDEEGTGDDQQDAGGKDLEEEAK